MLYSSDAQPPARGPNPARDGLQSGPRKDSETTFWNFRILKFVKNIMKKIEIIKLSAILKLFIKVMELQN